MSVTAGNRNRRLSLVSAPVKVARSPSWWVGSEVPNSRGRRKSREGLRVTGTPGGCSDGVRLLSGRDDLRVEETGTSPTLKTLVAPKTILAEVYLQSTGRGPEVGLGVGPALLRLGRLGGVSSPATHGEPPSTPPRHGPGDEGQQESTLHTCVRSHRLRPGSGNPPSPGSNVTGVTRVVEVPGVTGSRTEEGGFLLPLSGILTVGRPAPQTDQRPYGTRRRYTQSLNGPRPDPSKCHMDWVSSRRRVVPFVRHKDVGVHSDIGSSGPLTGPSRRRV